MSSAALFPALDAAEASRGEASTSRDVATSAPGAQPSIPVSTEPRHHTVPIRFRRYLRARHAESGTSSGARGDVEKSRSNEAEPQVQGSSATAQADTQGAAKPPGTREECTEDSESGQTNGESRGDQPHPRNKGRSRSRKIAAQTDNRALVQGEAAPQRRSKRLEEMKAAAERTSDSQSGTPTNPSERDDSCLWRARLSNLL